MKNKKWLSILFILGLGISLTACGAGQKAEPSATPTPVEETIPSPTAEITDTPVVEVTQTPPADPADVIFYNGTLITMEEDPHTAQALAVRDGTILAVGSDEEVLVLQGANTALIDLQGRTLMPGFVDGHTHLLTFYERMGRTLEDAQEIALAHGYTMVSEMWANEDVVQSFLQAEQEGRMRLRVNLFPSYNDGILGADRRRILLKTWYPAHGPILDPESMVRIPGIKIFVDGDNANYERGCWAMTDPLLPTAGSIQRGVCGTPSGDLYWQQDELNQVVKAAQEAGFRVAFHAMGDKAIEVALNAIGYALDGQSNTTYRHQIDHNSMIRPELLSRYVEMGVAATVRGHIELCGLSFLDSTFGPERQAWYVNRLELPNLEIHSFLETDFGWKVDPNERFDQRTLDPFMHLYGLATHRYASSETESCAPDPIAAAKVISVERALQMMTSEPAWAVSMEEYLGTLKAGKYADLNILSDDPLSIDPDELKDISVLMTMVAGKVEYCAEGQQALCP
jgi:predicted amidohydrolase YtcJ